MKQFNIYTCHTFTVDEMLQLEYEKQDYIDETIDALASVAKNVKNMPGIRYAALTMYRQFATQRNKEVRNPYYWPLGI